MKNALKGTMIASAVAALLSSCAHSAPAPMAGHDDKMSSTVKCAGINSCKGQGSCSGASNSCKGQNACKGQGWASAETEKACTDQGGKLVAM